MVSKVELGFLEPLQKIDKSMVDQFRGRYYLENTKPCSFGAHLSKIFKTPLYHDYYGQHYSYKDCDFYFYTKSGLNYNETMILFYLSGLREKGYTQWMAINPFSCCHWNMDIPELISRLKKIKYSEIKEFEYFVQKTIMDRINTISILKFINDGYKIKCRNNWKLWKKREV